MAEQLIVGITAQDNATPVFEKFKNSLKNVQTQIGQTQSGMGDFTKTLTEQLGKLPGLSDATNVLGNAVKLLKNPYIEGALAIGAATAAMIKFAFSNEENVIALKKMSLQTGISINALGALKKIANASDIDFQSLGGAVSKMEKNLGTNAEALKKVGVTSKDPLEALAQLADSYSKASTQSEKARIGSTALGKSYAELAPILEKGGAAIRAANNSESISPEMLARYEKMHENQKLITASAGAWKKLLGDIGSTFLSPIISGMAEIAQYALKAANYMKDALGYSSKNKVQELINKAGTQGEIAGNAHIKRGSTGLDFKSHYNDAAATNAADNELINSFKTLSSSEAASYSKLLSTWSKDELAKNHITQKTVQDLAAKYNTTDKSAVDVKPAKDNSAAIEAHAQFLEKMKEMNETFNLGTETDKTTLEEKKESERYDKERAAFLAEKAKIKGLTEADQVAINATLEAMDQDHVNKLNEIEEAGEKANIAAKLEQERAYAAELLKGVKQRESEEDERMAKFKADFEIEKAEYEAEQEKAKEVQKQWDDISRTIENALSSPYSNFIKNVTRGNKSLFSSFKSLASEMKDAFGNAVVEMVAKYLAQKSAMYVTDLAMQAASTVKSLAIGSAATETATAESVAAGTTAAAANAPAAALTSTWSFGSAAIAGGVALAAILALAKSSYAVGSTNIPYDQIAQIHKGEIIIPAKESQAARSGNLSPMLDFIGQNPSTTSSNSSPSDVSNSPINININGTNLTSKNVSTQVVNELRYYQKQNAWRRN